MIDRHTVIAKNVKFLAKNFLFASRKALEHFGKAIEVSRNIGSNSALFLAYLELGLFHGMNGKKESAKECLRAAIVILEKGGPSPRLEQAKEALAFLGG